MRFGILAGSALAIFWGLTLAGCSTSPKSEGGGATEQKAQSAEEMVRFRAQGRWDALLAGDLTKAYGFISPAGRSTMPQTVYNGRVSSQFWRKALVKSASCGSELCEVQIDLDYVVENVPLSRVLSEKWILDGGKWWFVYAG